MAEAGTSEAEADARKPAPPAVACPRKNYKPLSEEETASLFDSDGRLVRENKLRQALFEGTTRNNYGELCRRKIAPLKWKAVFQCAIVLVP